MPMQPTNNVRYSCYISYLLQINQTLTEQTFSSPMIYSTTIKIYIKEYISLHFQSLIIHFLLLLKCTNEVAHKFKINIIFTSSPVQYMERFQDT